MTPVPFDDQSDFQERFEWGEAGVRTLAPGSDVLIIVDVLSFATAVDVAVARGATVYPFRERGERAVAYARGVDALLAVDRSGQASEHAFSLSPHSLTAIPAGTRLVLPSPNGATLSLLAAELGAEVLLGCLRNASAVAAAARRLGETIAVVAAGERWRGVDAAQASLRPAVEDLVGAGAILRALDPDAPSPEAQVAMAAFHTAAPNLERFLRECASGKELRQASYAGDVELAAQYDVSQTVPFLRGAAIESLDLQAIQARSGSHRSQYHT